MMKEAAIIGAGQTGRGFIAPNLQLNGYHITFVDKNEKLIMQLYEEKFYTVRYFNECKKPIKICNYDAFPIMKEGLSDILANMDLIFTSVFAGNIADLVPLLTATAKRTRKEKIQIICCENGVHVKKPLLDAGIAACISEGVIFCTTLQPNTSSLQLVSEDICELPIDGNIEGMNIKIQGMPLEMNFSSLVQRKIYTYNFLSAMVAYLGDYMGYNLYGDAANDTQITYIMDQIVPLISKIMAKEYGIDYDVQFAFTLQAVHKFRNKQIFDTVFRNARQAERKLKKGERLYEPLRLAKKYKQKTGYIIATIAAAMRYAVIMEHTELPKLLHIYKDLDIETDLRTIYAMLIRKEALCTVFDYCENI